MRDQKTRLTKCTQSDGYRSISPVTSAKQPDTWLSGTEEFLTSTADTSTGYKLRPALTAFQKSALHKDKLLFSDAALQRHAFVFLNPHQLFLTTSMCLAGSTCTKASPHLPHCNLQRCGSTCTSASHSIKSCCVSEVERLPGACYFAWWM